MISANGALPGNNQHVSPLLSLILYFCLIKFILGMSIVKKIEINCDNFNFKYFYITGKYYLL